MQPTWLPVFLVGVLLMLAPASFAGVIVDDSWTDAGRNNGADALDTDWWTSTTSTAIEVSAGSLGLVSGTSGRGIHGTFSPQTLTNVGDSLKATFTFKTPATVATGATAAFKIGLFNTNGNSGLAADLSASSTTPNTIYDPLPGYMMDFDVNPASGANITFREKSPVPGSTGQLLGTTTGFVQLAGGGNAYSFAASTTYTGTYSITKTATGIDLSGSLSDGSGVLSTFTTSDSSPSATTFDLLGFHVNANIFGSSNAVNTADNGIDFTNIKIESAVPEPSAIAMVALLSAGAMRRRTRSGR
jgi:hypothetical protein